MKFLLSLIDLFFLLLPRFVTDTVAVRVYSDESWEILCFEDELKDDDQYSALAVYHAFTFLGEDYFSSFKVIPDSGNVGQ